MRNIWKIGTTAAAVLALLLWAGAAKAGQIHTAAEKGDLETVKSLVEGNPDLVNSKDDFGYTPLHWAAHEGHKDIVEYLLEHKADVNAKSNDDRTPLIWAVYQKGRKDVVELLIANGADVNAEDAQGWTALRWAEVSGATEEAEVIRKNGGKR